MPLYSELYHNYVGNTPIVPTPSSLVSSYTPPSYVGVTRGFTNPLVTAGATRTPSFSRGYIPKLTPITETPLTASRITALTRVNSPKYIPLHTSPTYQKARRIINTADIDVSATSRYAIRDVVSPIRDRDRYHSPSSPSSLSVSPDRNNNTIPSTSSTTPISVREQELMERHEARKARSAINRNRTVVRLNTIRARSKSRGSRGSTERKSPHPGTPPENTFEEDMMLYRDSNPKTTSSWRDQFRDELSLRPKRNEPAKSPGEILLEKHLIRDEDDPPILIENAIIYKSPPMKRRATIRRKSNNKIPSFHEICADINSDKLDDGLNAGELRRRASQIIEDEIAQFQEKLHKANGLMNDDLEDRLKEALEQQITDSGVEFTGEKKKQKKVKRTRTKPLPKIDADNQVVYDQQETPTAIKISADSPTIETTLATPKILAEVESIEESTVFKLPKKKKIDTSLDDKTEQKTNGQAEDSSKPNAAQVAEAKTTLPKPTGEKKQPVGELAQRKKTQELLKKMETLAKLTEKKLPSESIEAAKLGEEKKPPPVEDEKRRQQPYQKTDNKTLKEKAAPDKVELADKSKTTPIEKTDSKTTEPAKTTNEPSATTEVVKPPEMKPVVTEIQPEKKKAEQPKPTAPKPQPDSVKVTTVVPEKKSEPSKPTEVPEKKVEPPKKTLAQSDQLKTTVEKPKPDIPTTVATLEKVNEQAKPTPSLDKKVTEVKLDPSKIMVDQPKKTEVKPVTAEISVAQEKPTPTAKKTETVTLEKVIEQAKPAPSLDKKATEVKPNPSKAMVDNSKNTEVKPASTELSVTQEKPMPTAKKTEVKAVTDASAVVMKVTPEQTGEAKSEALKPEIPKPQPTIPAPKETPKPQPPVPAPKEIPKPLDITPKKPIPPQLPQTNTPPTETPKPDSPKQLKTPPEATQTTPPTTPIKKQAEVPPKPVEPPKPKPILKPAVRKKTAELKLPPPEPEPEDFWGIINTRETVSFARRKQSIERRNQLILLKFNESEENGSMEEEGPLTSPTEKVSKVVTTKLMPSPPAQEKTVVPQWPKPVEEEVPKPAKIVPEAVPKKAFEVTPVKVAEENKKISKEAVIADKKVLEESKKVETQKIEATTSKLNKTVEEGPKELSKVANPKETSPKAIVDANKKTEVISKDSAKPAVSEKIVEKKTDEAPKELLKPVVVKKILPDTKTEVPKMKDTESQNTGDIPKEPIKQEITAKVITEQPVDVKKKMEELPKLNEKKQEEPPKVVGFTKKPEEAPKLPVVEKKQDSPKEQPKFGGLKKITAEVPETKKPEEEVKKVIPEPKKVEQVGDLKKKSEKLPKQAELPEKKPEEVPKVSAFAKKLEEAKKAVAEAKEQPKFAVLKKINPEGSEAKKSEESAKKVMPEAPKPSEIKKAFLQPIEEPKALIGQKLSPKEIVKAIAPTIAAEAERKLAAQAQKMPNPAPVNAPKTPAEQEKTTKKQETAAPTAVEPKQQPKTTAPVPNSDEPAKKKVIVKKVIKVVKKVGSEPAGKVVDEAERRKAQENVEKMKAKVNQITLNMGVKLEVEIKECAKCQQATLSNTKAAALPVNKQQPKPNAIADRLNLMKNKFGAVADLSAASAGNRSVGNQVSTGAVQQQNKQTVVVPKAVVKKQYCSSSSSSEEDTASETSFSGIESDDWSSEEDDMANDKPEQKKKFDPQKRVKLNFEQMRKCYVKEEKSPIVLVARPRPLWKVKRHGHGHNRKADLTSSSSSGSENESGSTTDRTSTGTGTGSTVDGASSDLGSGSSVNSSRGAVGSGKQKKKPVKSVSKTSGGVSDIYDNPMVIPLHSEPVSSKCSTKDENNNEHSGSQQQHEEDDENNKNIGNHEVRSTSTSSHDSGFCGGGTAPISPKKAMGKWCGHDQGC